MATEQSLLSSYTCDRQITKTALIAAFTCTCQHTVFPRKLAVARFHFKAPLSVVTIQGLLDIEGSVCRDRQILIWNFAALILKPTYRSEYCACTYIKYNGRSFTSEISRAVFIGMICVIMRQHFEGGDNLMCAEISRKYGNLVLSWCCTHQTLIIWCVQHQDSAHNFGTSSQIT